MKSKVTKETEVVTISLSAGSSTFKTQTVMEETQTFLNVSPLGTVQP